MSYIALYRKWRPLVFEDVVEQEHVVKTLKNSISSRRIAHAYLFCGTRGTGKTTMAKIFSRAINCMNPIDSNPCNECEICKGILSGSNLDVVEIDAASNNSVDNVREIRDEVVYAPSQSKYKVYIIDEIHMLSTGAFNALLKTLEEPPEHVVFILATTEPHKLPATILSRCQRFDFRRITAQSITKRLEKIADSAGVGISEEASRLIARLSDGALRDAISLLDQCISIGKKHIEYEDVVKVAGIVNDEFTAELVNVVSARNVNRLFNLIAELVMEGKDISQFIADLIMYYRNLLICKISDKPGDMFDTSKEILARMIEQGKAIGRNELMNIIKELSSIESMLKWSAHPRVLLEMTLVKLCETPHVFDGSILERLAELESKVGNSGNSDTTNQNRDVAKEAKEKIAEISESGGKKSEPAIWQNTQTERNVITEWDKVITELKKSGRVALYTNLLETKAVEIDDRIIGIVFNDNSSFNKEMVSRAESLAVVENQLNAILGRQARVRCYLASEMSDVMVKERSKEDEEFLKIAEEISNKLKTPMTIIEE